MASKLHDLYEARNKAIAEMRQVHSEFTGAGTPEQQAKWDKAEGEVSRLEKEIADEKAAVLSAAERQKKLEAIEARNREALNDGRVGLDAEQRRRDDAERTDRRHEEVRALAFQSWALAQSKMPLRDEHRSVCRQLDFDPYSKDILLDAEGRMHIPSGSHADLPGGAPQRRYGAPAWSCGGTQTQREMRAGLDVTTTGAGKETIPQGFMANLDAKTLAYGNVRQVATVIGTATGNSLPWPTIDDTSNEAAILAEATSYSTSVDPTTAAITLLAYKLSSKPVFVSSEILQDSAFNLQMVLSDIMGVRFGRGETTYFTTGTNSSQPQGIVTAAGTGKTTAIATAFTTDELIDLFHSLDPSYRDLPSCGWMFHDTVLQYIRKMKDGDGQYLWQPGLVASVPDRILGKPYSINQKMEPLVNNVPVTAKKHVLFGAFEKYIIRDAGGVRMYHLTERARDTDQDVFVAFKRVDGRALNTSALKVLLQA